jgi:hypothetical protein
MSTQAEMQAMAERKMPGGVAVESKRSGSSNLAESRFVEA